DVVTVLLGTNDANGALSETNVRMMTKMKKLPVRPTITWYRENLNAIIERLVKETDARIALLSPPVLGQELGSDPVRQAAEYSRIVQDVAAVHEVAYLPLYERQLEHLRAVDRQPGIAFLDGKRLSSRAAMQHFLLGRSFDAISKRRGLELTTDFIHQNTRGAAMIAAVIEDFLRQSPLNQQPRPDGDSKYDGSACRAYCSSMIPGYGTFAGARGGRGGLTGIWR
ncbi:MAG TPA: hypothetical protein VGD15_15010, partial [Kribbella sp.]